MNNAHRFRRAGVTLVEVLVALGVIAVLLAISLAAFRRARITANDAKDLSNLRMTMLDFISYCNDHQGAWPNAGLPDAQDLWFYPPARSEWRTRIGLYESVAENWPMVLKRWSGASAEHWHSAYDDFTSGGRIDPSQARAEGRDLFGVQSKYLYSRTFVTRWDAWTNPGLNVPFEEYARTYFRIVRLSDVVSPSAKGVLRHDARPGNTDLRHCAFADGSASLRSMRAGRPTAVPPLWGSETPGLPILSTLHGYLGADY